LLNYLQSVGVVFSSSLLDGNSTLVMVRSDLHTRSIGMFTNRQSLFFSALGMDSMNFNISIQMSRIESYHEQNCSIHWSIRK
jgi:hypothetical protein